MRPALAKSHIPASAQAKRVLVIKFGALREFVQSLAAAKLIREHHLGARITLLTSEEFKPFAEKCPFFDVVETGAQSREPKQVAQLVSRLRKAKFDMAYDLECSPRTNNLYLGLRPWPRQWSGIAPGCAYPHANPARETMHPLDRYADQLHAAGLGPAAGFPPGAAPLPDLSWVRMAQRDPPRLQPGYFNLKPPYILLIPGSDPDHPDRLWPVERYAELTGLLAQRGIQAAIIGGPPEREIGQAINRAEPRAKNLVSRTDLFQVAALAERAAAAVGCDSGPMHIAAAAGAPCVVLYSRERDTTAIAPRGCAGVLKLLAPYVGDLPVADVIRAIGNLGALPTPVHA
jgi:ADP-heptose:LPS heptosyltransferase